MESSNSRRGGRGRVCRCREAKLEGRSAHVVEAGAVRPEAADGTGAGARATGW